MSKLTIGSLFDGIGGFPIVAQMYGVEPVWASEIEEPCIRITKRHFPNMKHYGDITKMNGAEIEPVDIISGGSPCFPAGTMILTSEGYIDIKDVKVGDIVYTHLGNWKKVTAVGNRQAETIILQGDCPLETTRNHPIYSFDDSGNKVWIPAENMFGKWWATPKQFPVSQFNMYSVFKQNLWSDIGKAKALATRFFAEQHFDTELLLKSDGTYTVGVNYYDSDLPDDKLFSWHKVTSIVSTGETKTVYNISVDEDESYIADSIVVHNCQDLSTAGKQAGISHKCSACGMILPIDFSEDTCPKCGAEVEFTRSGLFMEQIRLIKEMRKATNERFPKVVVWENVFGCTNSNNGDDFQCVLSEFAGLFGEKLPTLRPEKWCKAGEIVGDNGSLAWRTLDAQYWGVPQRRRRIYLVVDLTGQRAGEILFKSESLRRHTPQGEIPWKRTTSEIKSSLGTADRAGKAKSEEVKPLAIATQQVNAEMSEDVSPTLTAANGTSGSNRVFVVLNDQGGSVMDVSENITGTLRAESHGHAPIVVDSEKEVYGICSMASNSMKSDKPDSGIYKTDVIKTLDTSGSNPSCNQGGNVVVESPVYCIQGNCIDRADTAGCNGKGWKEDVAYTLTTIDRPAVAYSVHENQVSDVTITEELASTITTGGGKPGQGYPCVLEEKSAKAYGVCSKGNGDTFLSDKAYTMTTGGGQAGQGYPCILEEKSDCAAFLGKQGDSARGIGYSEKVAPTLTAGEPPQVVEYNEQIPYAGGGFADYDEGKFATLKASGGDVGGGSETLVAGFAYQVGPGIPHLPYTEEKSPTLVSNQQMGVLIDNHGQDCRWKECKDGICPTLNANMGMGGNNQPLYVEPTIVASKASFFTRASEHDVAECLVATDYKDPQIVLKPNSVVRRLTPIECARLQGFPDTWLDGESDAAQYKALGNSVALPCVDYVISGVVDVLDPID